MKMLRALLAIFLICLLLLPGCGKKQTYSVYKYPVRPGTEEWARLDGHGAMLEACELPEEWLKADTATLLGCVLTYPLLADAFMSSTFGANPAEVLAEEFDGMKELLKRDDLAKVAKEFDMEVLVFSKEYEKKIAQKMLTVLQEYSN